LKFKYGVSFLVDFCVFVLSWHLFFATKNLKLNIAFEVLKGVAFVDCSALKNETIKQKEIVLPEQSSKKKII